MTNVIVILIALGLAFGWFALVAQIERWADKEFGGVANDDETDL